MITSKQYQQIKSSIKDQLHTVSKDQNSFTSCDGAEADSQSGELDHDEPPDGQGEGQPDGDCVDHDAEVGVEKEKDCPSKRELQRQSRLFFLLI